MKARRTRPVRKVVPLQRPAPLPVILEPSEHTDEAAVERLVDILDRLLGPPVQE